MYLSELLANERIYPKIACSSKDELLSIVLEKIYHSSEKFPLSQEELLKALDLREKIGGTMLPSGLSIPHARIKEYEGFVLALATPSEPIFYEGIQVRMMSMMLTSQQGGPNYLPCLAALTKLSRDPELFSILCDEVDPEKFLLAIKGKDLELL
ncbi:MAG: PTS sugar transporter subunit IIA [Treponema sp.]|nr:PTS sugar transporter subunit IIA [Treponema sp.]